MIINDSIHIDASIEHVFDIFSDLSKAADRINGITSIEMVQGPAQMIVGTRWRETRVMFGKEVTEEMWVTEITPNERYVVVAELGSTHYRSVYTFLPENNGTRVDTTFEGKAQSLGAKLMMPLGFLFAGATKKAMHQDLEDLKVVCED